VSATHEVAIVGGGIAGLSAAHALAKAGRDFVLLEAAARLGGVITTERRDGFLLEGGPDTLLGQKPDALALARELGLEGRIVPTNPRSRAVYVLRAGRLHALPEGMLLAVPTRILPFLRSRLFSWPGKLRMGLDLLMRPRPAPPDESIGSFLKRHFGTECVERLGEPLLAGIHAGDPWRLSMRGTFPRFVDLETRTGSLVRGLRRAAPPAPGAGTSPPPGFFSFQDGLGELVDALVKRLPADRLIRSCPVRSLEPRPGGGYRLGADGRDFAARSVIVATPAPTSARLVEPFAPKAALGLRSIPFASTATVSLGYRRGDVAHPLEGYGLVVPRGEGLRSTALSFVSTKLAGRAPEGAVLLRGFLGGVRDPGVLGLEDAALVALVQDEFRGLLGLRGAPVLSHVTRWPERTPQLEVGHFDRLAALEAALQACPGLFLSGSGLRGTGIPDMIADGRQCAERALTGLGAAVA